MGAGRGFIMALIDKGFCLYFEDYFPRDFRSVKSIAAGRWHNGIKVYYLAVGERRLWIVMMMMMMMRIGFGKL